jgi:dCTP deaminase
LIFLVGFRARANPKSSTGRVDVFTRVITDGSYLFDDVADGYKGPLYLEVVPLSFAVRVREDLSLNQLRLSVGKTGLSDEEVRREHEKRPILFRNDVPISPESLPLDNGLFLGLDLAGGNDGFVGYRARDNAPLLDLTLGGPVYPDPYWEPVRHEEYDRLMLGREEFYLLMSEESISVPPSLAAEMTAFDPASGELRTHYAGFFDPGFGYSLGEASRGSRAALEVRAHDVAFMVEHGQRVCKLTFERMLEEPGTLYGMNLGSSYQDQTGPLGKQFISQRPERVAPRATPPGQEERLF